MTNLFETIIRTNPKMEGWCDIPKAITLASMVLALRPECVLEVGIFGGRSFLPMALACKELGRGVVVGIDPWDKGVSVRGQTSPEDIKWWSELDMEKIRTGFMALIPEHGLEKFTKIHRMESNRVASPTNIGILHIDGNHDATAIQDVMNFAPHVVQGGFCVMDDLNMFGGFTNRAAQRLQQMKFKQLYALGTGMVFQKT